jgi:hypothetical protein
VVATGFISGIDRSIIISCKRDKSMWLDAVNHRDHFYFVTMIQDERTFTFNEKAAFLRV